MNKRKTILFLSIFNLLCFSCEEDVPGGLSTRITGQVVDSVKNKSIENANVILIACNPNFYNNGCSNIIDSVRTNSDGKFELNFVTSGKDNAYIIGVEEDQEMIIFSTDTVIAGQLNEVQLYVRELNVLTVKLQIEANSVGPIRLITPGGTTNVIDQATRDITVYGRVIPLTTNWFTFDVYENELNPINKRRKDTDTIEVDLSDTVLFIKKIIDPKEWSAN